MLSVWEKTEIVETNNKIVVSVFLKKGSSEVMDKVIAEY